MIKEDSTPIPAVNFNGIINPEEEIDLAKAYMTPTLNAQETDGKDSEKNQPMHLRHIK